MSPTPNTFATAFDAGFTSVVEVILEPFGRVGMPTQRVYWVFIAAAWVLAVAVLYRTSKQTAPKLSQAIATSISLRIWLHRSSRADMKLMFANAAIRAVFITPWIASVMATTIYFVGRLDSVFGVPIPLPSPGIVIPVLYSSLLFIALDASRFVVHWAMHRFSFLWQFHQVHHSAQVLTPLTLFRAHPVESILLSVRGVVVTAFVTSLFFYFFRTRIFAYEILGVNALGFIFNFLGANLRHSHVKLRFPNWLERWLISPAQHQLHHSVHPAEHHANFGTWLAIWDRMANSLRVSKSGMGNRFGLRHNARNHDPHRLLSMLIDPFRFMFRTSKSSRRTTAQTASMLTVTGALVVLHNSVAHAEQQPTQPVATQPVATPPVATQPATTPPATTPPEATPLAQPPTTPAVEIPPAEPASDAPIEIIDDEPIEIGDDEPIEIGDESEGGDEAAAAAANAIEADEDVDPYQIDTVWIVGNADEIPRVAGSAHVVGEKELEKFEHDNVHDVLKSVPGVYVRGEDGFGLRPNIGLRGANSDRSSKVTLMEDGILLTPAPYSAPAAYYFPLTTRMTAVEVFKGPASIKYGPNTIGGAINLVTRSIPNKSEGGIDLGLGRYGYGKAHAHWGYGEEQWGILAEGARIQSDGFKELDNGGSTGFGKNEAMLKGRVNSKLGGKHFHQASVKLGYANEESNETYLGLSDTDFALTPNRRYAGSQLDKMRWNRTQGQLQYYYTYDESIDVQVTAYQHNFERSWAKLNGFRDGPALDAILARPDAGQNAVYYAFLTGQEDSTDALMLGTNARGYLSRGVSSVTRWRAAFREVEHELEFGARIHNDHIQRNHYEDAYAMQNGTMVAETSSTDAGDQTFTTQNTGEATAGAFHLHERLTWRRFTVTPGLRTEVIQTAFTNHMDVDSARATNNYAVVLPGAGAHVAATDWLSFFGGAHAGFSPVAPGQSPEVLPERSINYEGGLRLQHKQSKLETIGFLNDYRNLTGECTFSSGCNDTQINQQFNAGRVHVFGLEALAAQAIPLPRKHFIEARASYTLTQSRFKTAFDSAFPLFQDVVVGDELPYVPEHQASLGLSGGGRRWTAHVDGSYTSQMRDIAGQGAPAPDEAIPAYFLLNLGADFRVTKLAKVYGTATNVLNQSYMISRRPFGTRPGMPLAWSAGLKVDFR